MIDEDEWRAALAELTERDYAVMDDDTHPSMRRQRVAT
jgi:hypothetical protein